MTAPNTDEIREHLAYEIHYLVLAAVKFPEVGNQESACYQDSALIHARNLIEFTSPKRKQYGWWIVDLGGNKPKNDASYQSWHSYISSKVAHLGDGRLDNSLMPAAKSEHYLISLAQELLERISDNLPKESSDERVSAMRSLVELGQQYLNSPSEKSLSKIAQAIDRPIS